MQQRFLWRYAFVILRSEEVSIQPTMIQMLMALTRLPWVLNLTMSKLN
jgi:hypothetical protein